MEAAKLLNAVPTASSGNKGKVTHERAPDKRKKYSWGGKMILARLSEIPIATWNYKSQDPSIRHMGPVAQDFSSAFGLGDSDKHINTIDLDGVALAAIQGLYQIVKEKEEEIEKIARENRELKEAIREINKRLAAMGLPSPTPIEK